MTTGTIGRFWRLWARIKREPSTREDMVEMLSGDTLTEQLDKDEIAMLRGVLEVSEAQVRDVMIPRSQMVVLDSDAPKKAVLKKIVESGHSRFPVIGEDRDEVVGILLAKDMLSHFILRPDEDFNFGAFLRPATFIPESKRLNTLLKEFRVSRNHMAIVVDEYGSTSGLLTIEDVLEEIVGEIDDEHDPAAVELIQDRGDSRYQVRALTRIDEFNEYFDSDLSDEEYDTIGGLVIHALGRMPRLGESAAVGGFHFKVIQADRRRVHALEVWRDERAPGEETAATS
jgi:magnesium and cobalt transporter